MGGLLKDLLIGLGLQMGVPILAEFMRTKLGIGMDNRVVDAFCEYQQGHKNLKAIAKSKVKRCFGPKCDTDRQTLGGNR